MIFDNLHTLSHVTAMEVKIRAHIYTWLLVVWRKMIKIYSKMVHLAIYDPFLQTFQDIHWKQGPHVDLKKFPFFRYHSTPPTPENDIQISNT